MKRQKILPRLLGIVLLPVATALVAAEYEIDTKDSHAFIQFKIPHLGYSWLLGRFNTFEGRFSYDEKAPSSSWVEVTIQTNSIDSNHAERDKHLRDEDFLAVRSFPEARFVSTSYTEKADGKGILKGNLTLRGVTRPIRIEVKQIGAGMDPWGGYRRGFEGETRLTLKNYGIDFNLGAASREVQLGLYLEGIRQDNRTKRVKR
ncbi:MAG: YceI family protein [Pseudomonadota bacterium]